MKLVLFRHGDKAFDGTNNPPLSEIGLEQASNIAAMVSHTRLPRPSQIWVSPKKRTQQTMQALADWAQTPWQIQADLEEKQDGETAVQFRNRIERVIQQLQEQESTTSCIYLCSHLDWIEEFLIQIPSDTDLSSPMYQHWGSAQYMVFSVQNSLFEMQIFKRVELL